MPNGYEKNYFSERSSNVYKCMVLGLIKE